MKVSIQSSGISGSVTAPASKSFAQRALAAALLSKGTTILRRPSLCDDVLAAMDVIENLGASFENFGDRIIVHGGLKPKTSKLNFGEAGLGIRLFSAIAALHNDVITLEGIGSLGKRPMGMIAEALQALGAQCETNQGYLPISINGPIQGGTIVVDGSLSSQVLSGLLMALPLAQNDSIIKVNNLKSKPYIDMTLSVMDRFCIKYDRTGYEEFRIPGRQFYYPTEFDIEGDWSGAAFLLVAGAIAGEVTVKGLDPESTQADKKILEALLQSGAKLEVQADHIICQKSDLTAFSFDATHCPDLFPPLVCLAAHCKGQSQISGVHRLIHKESNRAEALLTEMRKLGLEIQIEGDQMLITGCQTIQSAEVDSHNDHRIAMSAAIVGLPGQVMIGIQDAQCINKSYPEFYEDLKQIGGTVHE